MLRLVRFKALPPRPPAHHLHLIKLAHACNLSIDTVYAQNKKLTGDIPAELWTLTKLESVKLSGNGLTGTLPKEVGDLVKMRTL